MKTGSSTHIEDTAEHHAGTGLFRMALTPKQMAQRQAHHGWHAAQYHHPEKIFFCIAIGIRAGSQKIKQRYAREPGAQGKEKRHRRSSPNAEYGHIFYVLVVLRPHHPGNQAAAAQAEQVPQRREQIEPGRYQGNGGHHQRVAQLSHKKGICQVVNHSHHLADDGGDRQGRHRFWHRHFFEQIFFRIFFHCVHRFLSKEIGRPRPKKVGACRYGKQAG